jgi:hypothetical protein
MRTTNLLSSGLLTTLAFTVATGAAGAASPTRYDGAFGGTIVYSGCRTTAPAGTATGTWSVTLHGKSAKAVFDIYVNGQPHVAYTYPGMKRLPVEEPTAFSVTGATQAGPLTVTLTGSQLTYTIAPYDYGGLSCDNVTYPGGR